MPTTFMIIQIVLSALLALVILLQNRGAGLGSLAGGGGSGFHSERRGAEKMLHTLTIVLGVAFCANALLMPLFA